MKTGYDRKEQIEMSEYGYIVKMKCLTNMHVGDGEENYSIIDKMVERDPVTKYPSIIFNSLFIHLDGGGISKFYTAVSCTE